MLDIIIPFHNQAARVRACLRSLQASAPPSARIIAVDDASRPEEAALVEETVGQMSRPVEVITRPVNRGFRESVMAGIEASSNPYVLLLNSDTIATPGFADLLLEVMQRAPDIAAVAPVSHVATDLYQQRPGFPEVPSTPPGPIREVLAYAKARRAEFAGKVTEAPYLTGMCLAVERAAAESVGWFCRDYVHGYFEDLDLCCRLRAAGRRLAIREDCFVYHVGHASYGNFDRTRIAPALMNNYRLFSMRWGHLPEHAELLRLIQRAGEGPAIGALPEEDALDGAVAAEETAHV